MIRVTAADRRGRTRRRAHLDPHAGFWRLRSRARAARESVIARRRCAAGARSSGGGVLRERLWKIRARHIVSAAGAFERPMMFPDNDRPGVHVGRRGRQICARLWGRLRTARADRREQRFRLRDRRLVANRRGERGCACRSPCTRGHDAAAATLRRGPRDLACYGGRHCRGLGTAAVRGCTVVYDGAGRTSRSNATRS